MGHVPRCLVEDLGTGPDVELVLDDDRRHHLQRVLRLRPGDPVELVDGRGGLALATWRGQGRVAVTDRQPRRAPTAAPVTLAVAIPRRPRLAWLVEKAAELDVAALILLSTEHGAHRLGSGTQGKLIRRADEALLQCRRLHRMTVAGPRTLDAVFAEHAGHQIWLAAAPAPDTVTDEARRGEPHSVSPEARGLVTRDGRGLLILVGPEGDWSAAEVDRIGAAGGQRITLGATVLRVETAALALAALAALR